MAAALAVKNLVHRYGTLEAVRGVSFEVAAGEIFGLLGPNGAGKTTTLESILGLIVPDDGRIEICGMDARKDSRMARAKTGAVLQATGLQDKITPREALDLFAVFHAAPLKSDALLARFGLVEKADAAFVFIGTRPHSDWLPPTVLRNAKGFVLTGHDATYSEAFTRIWKEDRDPLPLETTVAGVFAAGDLRAGAMNRVASAVGEGAMAVRLVSEYLART